MALINDMNALTQKFAAFKTKLMNALIAKGVASTDADTCSVMADKVAEIPTNVELTDSYTFKTSLDDYLNKICIFKSLPIGMTYYFSDLPITKIPNIDLSKVTSLNCAFRNTKLISFPIVDTSLVKVFNLCFGDCYNLTEVLGMDFSSGTICNSCFMNCSKLNYILIKNLGTQSSAVLTGIFTNTIFGQKSDAARQSMVDTLLTYSYDRATAGYTALTVTLPAASLALLTDTEKAAITAKGYTLAS